MGEGGVGERCTLDFGNELIIVFAQGNNQTEFGNHLKTAKKNFGDGPYDLC